MEAAQHGSRTKQDTNVIGNRQQHKGQEGRNKCLCLLIFLLLRIIHVYITLYIVFVDNVFSFIPRSLLAQDSVHTQNTQSGTELYTLCTTLMLCILIVCHTCVFDCVSCLLEFSLSELLGEWHHDRRQSLLKDVIELLRTPTNLPSPQASTSNALTHTGTRWAIERFRYKVCLWPTY